MRNIYDPRFQVVTIAKMENPQRVIYQALRQDYSEGNVSDPLAFQESEQRYGELVIKHLLEGDKGHYGPLEHPQIVFNCIGFPHDTIMQARTHRVGISFDVQSSRYSGQRFIDVAKHRKDVEDVFYARPVGEYKDREGHSAYYSPMMREEDLALAYESCVRYSDRIDAGVAPEAARQFVSQGFRQNMVVSMNLRTLLHFLDLRSKADAQPEIQALSDGLFDRAMLWAPEIVEWYKNKRLHKARLAP